LGDPAREGGIIGLLAELPEDHQSAAHGPRERVKPQEMMAGLKRRVYDRPLADDVPGEAARGEQPDNYDRCRGKLEELDLSMGLGRRA